MKFFIISFLILVMPVRIMPMQYMPYFTSLTRILDGVKQVCDKNYNFKSFIITGGLMGTGVALYFAVKSFKQQYQPFNDFKEKSLIDDDRTIEYKYLSLNDLTIRYPSTVECSIKNTSDNHARVIIISPKIINIYDFNHSKGIFIWDNNDLIEDSTNGIVRPTNSTFL